MQKSTNDHSNIMRLNY